MILASPDRIKEYTEQGCWLDRTLLDDFRENVKRDPEHIAIIDPLNKTELLGRAPERVTHRRMARAVEGVASALKAGGLAKDDIVLVQLPNCWEMAMLYLAIARTGAIISPLPVQWREREIGYVADLTGAKLLITVESFQGFDHLSMARRLIQEVPSLKSVLSYGQLLDMMDTEPDPELDIIPLDANDILTICWTSGTEAQPKGCPLSHNNWRCLAALAMAGGNKPGDIMLTAGPLVNMASVGTVLVPWIIYGGTVVLHHPFNPALLLKQLVEEKVNYTLLVPAVMNLILKHPMAAGVDLSAIRAVTVGSAPPSLWAMKEFEKRWNIQMGNIWGQNEGTGIVSSLADVPEMELRVDHLPRYGAPCYTWSEEMANHVQTKLVDAEGRTVTEDGAVGEMLYRGPGVIQGYFNRPDLNKKAFDQEGYFRSGDLFQIKGDRYLRFFDRVKDIIIRGGQNISAQEVENILQAHPLIQDVAAVGLPDGSLGERNCVCVVPKSGETLTLKGIIEFMKENGTAAYKIPQRLEIVDSIPRNPVGKIMKDVLRRELMAATKNKN